MKKGARPFFFLGGGRGQGKAGQGRAGQGGAGRGGGGGRVVGGWWEGEGEEKEILLLWGFFGSCIVDISI